MNIQCPMCGAPAVTVEHEVGTAKGGSTAVQYAPDTFIAADMRHALTRMGYNLDAADLFMANLRTAGFALPATVGAGDPKDSPTFEATLAEVRKEIAPLVEPLRQPLKDGDLELRVGAGDRPPAPQPDEFFKGWNPGWVQLWKEHEAKHPTPPGGGTWEQAYRHLALAVDDMPDTCDDNCNSYGHSEACGAKQSAWPAEEIVRLRAALGDRPPALREPNAVQLEAVAQTLWEEFGDGDVAWDNATASDREGFRRCAGYAIGAYKRAVRPTPRAPSAAAIQRAIELLEAEYEVYVLRGDKGVSFTSEEKLAIRERVLRAAYAVDCGASPAAAPPQEDP